MISLLLTSCAASSTLQFVLLLKSEMALFIEQLVHQSSQTLQIALLCSHVLFVDLPFSSAAFKINDNSISAFVNNNVFRFNNPSDNSHPV
jgi:hypothetical protein